MAREGGRNLLEVGRGPKRDDPFAAGVIQELAGRRNNEEVVRRASRTFASLRALLVHYWLPNWRSKEVALESNRLERARRAR